MEKVKNLISTFTEFTDKKNIIENAIMSSYTSFKVGGPASLLVLPENTDELRNIMAVCKDKDTDVFVIGNGSNLVVLDGGYDGVIIKIGDSFSDVRVENSVNDNNSLEEFSIVTAGAGALLGFVSKEACRAGLSGMEFASGIPGSIGGAVVMNAGAYDGEMKDILLSVKSLDKAGVIHERSGSELELGYRHSIFQDNGEVVLSCKLKLRKGNPDDISAKIKELNIKRNTKQPVNLPSAGSVFRRPEGQFAGKLIEDAGLKGLKLGGARVSPLHSGFIVNEGGATASDIIRLIKIIQATVLERFNVELVPELKIIGVDEK